MTTIDDINGLELRILSINEDIAGIDLQLDINEIHADGDDEYFEWIKRAKTAKFHKVKALHKLTLELKNLNRLAHSKKDKKQSPDGNIMHQALAKSQVELRLNKEAEKTKRHQISEDVNLKVFKVFKAEVSELIGHDEYIKLIEKCRVIAESK